MGNLTDLQIRSWLKKGERFEGRSDGGGLYLRYRTSDKKPTWRFRYRMLGKGRVVCLGSYPDVTLSKVREVARELSARVALGFDVAEEKKERKAGFLAKLNEDNNGKTVADIANSFYEQLILPRHKRPEQIRQNIDKDIIPKLGKLNLKKVTASDIDNMIKAIVARGAPATANDVLSLIKRIFSYAIRRRYMENNPAISFGCEDAGGQEKGRKRWLTCDELKCFFKTMKSIDSFNKQNELTIKLLLALCCRKMELCAAKWDEFDFECAIWHLPEERTKTGEGIDIPLSEPVLEWLRELKGFSYNSQWILPARAVRERFAMHISECTINVALSKVRSNMSPDILPFTVHDFRRTARTHLAALGIDPIVAERCLNHTIKGIEGIYNRHQYLNERRVALEKWSELLVSLENS